MCTGSNLPCSTNECCTALTLKQLYRIATPLQHMRRPRWAMQFLIALLEKLGLQFNFRLFRHDAHFALMMRSGLLTTYVQSSWLAEDVHPPPPASASPHLPGSIFYLTVTYIVCPVYKSQTYTHSCATWSSIAWSKAILAIPQLQIHPCTCTCWQDAECIEDVESNFICCQQKIPFYIYKVCIVVITMASHEGTVPKTQLVYCLPNSHRLCSNSFLVMQYRVIHRVTVMLTCQITVFKSW